LALVRGFWKRSAWAGVVAALVGAGLFSVASANAAVRLKHDKANETRFSLDGSSLTVTVVDLPRYEQRPPTLERLSGKEVRVACGTSFRRDRRKTVAVSLTRWPVGVRSMSFTLSRDVSRAAKWCLIEQWEDYGFDIAFVSFRNAEPLRLVARGALGDGTRWRFVGGRGERLEPCLQLWIRRGGGYGTCFEDQAEREANLASTVISPKCDGELLLVGVASRRARTVAAVLSDGSVVVSELHGRPAGSRVRAKYFIAELPPRSAVVHVTARDADGRRIARKRNRGMFGDLCDRE
jgi:hypothetical protein